MKFDFFLTLFENSLKNLYKIQQLAFIPHKPQRLTITATKWAIIDFLTCLLRKVINQRSSWSSTFSSLSWKILWKICLKSKNWHLFLHKLRRCIITAKKSIKDFLTCRLQKLLINVLHEVRLFFHSLENSLKNLYKNQQLALFLHKFKR